VARGVSLRTEIVADGKLIDNTDRPFRAHIQIVSREIGTTIKGLAILT